MYYNSEPHSHRDHIDGTIATLVDELNQPTHLARPRSCFLCLPAETRARIYFYMCSAVSIDVSHEVTRTIAEQHHRQVINTLLSCRTVWLEMLPVVSDATTVNIHTRKLLAPESQVSGEFLPLQLVPPIFRHARNVVGHWRPEYAFHHARTTAVELLKPTLPTKADQWQRFGWRSVKMVLKISIPADQTSSARLFEVAVTEQLNKFCNVRDFTACVPGIDARVEVNIWAGRLRCYVGKAVVRHNEVDMKMWRIVVPSESEVVGVLHKVFGTSKHEASSRHPLDGHAGVRLR